MTRRPIAVLVAISALVVACSGGGGTTSVPSVPVATPSSVPTTVAASPSPAPSTVKLRVAFFAASSQNGFSQAVWQGVQQQAAKVGAEATLYDGQFDAAKQLSQVEDATTSGKFNGFVIVANDTVGIATAIENAWTKSKIPTVTTLFPIGPDLTTLKAQVPGIIGTIGRPPADGAKLQADSLVDYCEGKDPCKVVILIGQLQYPFDKLRYDTYQQVLAQHSNIKVVATGQGNYDRDASLKAMQDILQANPKIDAILSNADQHTEGAVLALQSAGIEPKSIFLTGAGATEAGIAAVRSGEWTNLLADYPFSMGTNAVDVLGKFYQGQTTPAAINEDTFQSFPPLVTQDILKANPDFVGEWKG
jgi:ribose transport system substrate-binding protein